MTTWWWVRHGPTHEKAILGWRDVPADLSDLPALERLRDFLPTEALVVSSDLVRASATAAAIAGPRRRLPDTPLLREFNFGDWDGLRHADVADRDPQRSRDYWESPGDVAPPGGESWNQCAARVRRFVDRVNGAHRGADIVAVAHIGVIMTQIERASGWPPARVIGHRIDNLSVTRLRAGDRWHVDFINHLP